MILVFYQCTEVCAVTFHGVLNSHHRALGTADGLCPRRAYQEGDSAGGVGQAANMRFVGGPHPVLARLAVGINLLISSRILFPSKNSVD